MANTALAAVLDTIKKQNANDLRGQYGGKPSNMFVAEVKGSALFQFNSGELLSAAPTAMSMLCACYVAASSEAADKINLNDAMPTEGFKFLTRRSEPTLRSCLIDVCTNGGRDAFTLASRNMESLKQASNKIVEEQVPHLLMMLGDVTKSEDHLEDFQVALGRFSKEAGSCAKRAAEIQSGFNNWGRMVGELHMTTEQKSGQTSIEANKTAMDMQLADIERTFSVRNPDAGKEQVASVKKALENAEKRLDQTVNKVPGPWESLVQSTVDSFVQAIPAMTAAALPGALAGANPTGAAVNNVLGAARQGQATNGASGASVAPTTQPLSNDPASAVAYQVAHVFTAFLTFLGDENSQMDWSKFEVSPACRSGENETTEQGINWLLGQLKREQSDFHDSGSEASKRLSSAFAQAITVANEIKVLQEKSNNEKPGADVVKKWRADVKDAKNNVLSLSAASGSTASINAPPRLQVEATKPGLSAQTAQLNSAVQGLQIAQTAVDSAQANFDEALRKQAAAARAMLAVEEKLKSLNDHSKLLENINAILKDSIAVLVDLSVQFGKLEKFFSLTCSLIDDIILKKTEVFAKQSDRADNRSQKNKAITASTIAGQVIYTSILQTKAYFSMLYDIAYMYVHIDRNHIVPGLDMCGEFSRGNARGMSQDNMQAMSRDYNERSGKTVKELVGQKQEDLVRDLKARAQRASESAALIEKSLLENGLAADNGAKEAIKDGGTGAQQGAKAVLGTIPSRTAEHISLSNL